MVGLLGTTRFLLLQAGAISAVPSTPPARVCLRVAVARMYTWFKPMTYVWAPGTSVLTRASRARFADQRHGEYFRGRAGRGSVPDRQIAPRRVPGRGMRRTLHVRTLHVWKGTHEFVTIVPDVEAVLREVLEIRVAWLANEYNLAGVIILGMWCRMHDGVASSDLNITGRVNRQAAMDLRNEKRAGEAEFYVSTVRMRTVLT